MQLAKEIFSSVDTRCWRRDQVLILSLEGSRPRITADVLHSIERAIAQAEHDAMPLVLTGAGEHFAFGADLDSALDAAARGRTEALCAALRAYQRVMLKLRHASVATIAAARGVAVSGGCEVLMHCTRVVAHARSIIGLFEASAGVVPGGGGLKEFARRAARAADPAASIEHAFRTVATSTLARTARDAQALGFLTTQDRVSGEDLLDDAVALARELHGQGHNPPPVNPEFWCGGSSLLRRLRTAQERLLVAGEITLHQFEINVRIATVLCGGDLPEGIRTEDELLTLERVHFEALARMPLSYARFAHLRATGKPLSN